MSCWTGYNKDSIDGVREGVIIPNTCICMCMLSHFQLFATPGTVAHQASLVHGIFLARILEWVAISSSRGSSWPRDWTHISFIGRQILYNLSHQGSLWRLQISYFIKGPSLGIFWNFLLMIRFRLCIFVSNITEWYCNFLPIAINDLTLWEAAFKLVLIIF